MPDPFLSAADLTAYRKGPVEDDLAAIALDSACQIVRDHVSQAVDAVVDDTVVLDSEGTDTLLLPELPVTAVTSVAGPLAAPLNEGTDYFVDLEAGALRTRRGLHFLPGRALYTVVYSHGWTTVPSSVRVVALNLAARIYDQQLVRQESVGGYQAVYAAEEAITLTRGERAILAKHDPGRRR